MQDKTIFRLNDALETPIMAVSCPADLSELSTVERQGRAREIYERPGIVVVDGVLDEGTLIGLREGLSDKRRKFKDKFSEGVPSTETFQQAYSYTINRITELTKRLFGYTLKGDGGRSYRPMISENEPLHFDTYPVECGKTPLMSVLNFDGRSRDWKVGPSFREICRDHPRDVEEILKALNPGESPSVRLRTAGERGTGPLRSGTPRHEINFAPGAVWFANPKTISHQIIYGGGAFFQTWTIDEPVCGCQKCIIEKAGLSVPNLARGRVETSANSV